MGTTARETAVALFFFLRIIPFPDHYANSSESFHN